VRDPAIGIEMNMAQTARPSTDRSAAEQSSPLRNRPLMTLAAGHGTVDMYSGVLPILYPLLTDKFELNLSTVGLVALAYSGMAALSQPFFGWVADRHGTRFIGICLMWTAFTYSMLGFIPSFPALLVLAALAGIGSGAYHPMGALTAGAVSADSNRNTAMSYYVTGGTLGVAAGPLVGAAIFSLFGTKGTAVMVIPGLSISLWLLVQMRTISKQMPVRNRRERVAPAPIPVAALAIVIGLMMLRSWTLFGIQSFIPTWYKEMGYSSAFYGSLATVLLLTSALGTIGSGSLADRYGRRVVLVASSALSVPCVLLFAQFPGYPAFLTAGLLGLLAASTGPLLLVMAQQMMAGRAGVASGLILGIGFFTGAIGVPIIGVIGDHWGIQNAMRCQAIVAASTIIVSMMLPTEAKVRELVARVAPEPVKPAVATGVSGDSR
jgi:FSR family fosmidomycin resistance protein-like MFS transporter